MQLFLGRRPSLCNFKIRQKPAEGWRCVNTDLNVVSSLYHSPSPRSNPHHLLRFAGEKLRPGLVQSVRSCSLRSGFSKVRFSSCP